MQIAIVGAGGIAENHYRGYIQAGASVVAFAEPVAATRERREKEWNAKGYATFAEVLQHHPEVQAISVCTPNAFHLPSTLEAVSKGIHVLCEKPLSMSLAECQQMIDAAQKAGVVLQTGHHLRSNHYVLQAKKLIDNGTLGKVTFIRLRQSHDWAGAKTVHPNFGSLAKAGGGTMLDNGCHMYDLARYLVGDVQSIFAQTATLAFDVEVEDVSMAQLKFASGALGSIENSWSASGWEEGFWIYGTEGTLECVVRNNQPRYLKHFSRGSGSGEWGGVDEVVYKLHHEGGHAQQVQYFVDATQGKRSVICSGEDGLQSVRLVLSGYESAKTGQVVQFV